MPDRPVETKEGRERAPAMSRRQAFRDVALASGGLGAGALLLRTEDGAAGARAAAYDVREFGATGDGRSDDTEAIQTAIAAASRGGGGVVLFPAGTYVTGTLTIPSYVHLTGSGNRATTLRLQGSTDGALVTTEGFADLTGTDSPLGPEKFGIHSMQLDGNGRSNESGRTLELYGRGYYLEDIEIVDSADAALYSEWYAGGDDMEAMIVNFRVHGSRGDGIQWMGPHDSQFVNGEVIATTGTGIRTAGAAGAEQFANVHVWGPQREAWRLGVPALMLGCEGEGSGDVNLWIESDGVSVIGGQFFGAPTCIRLGTADGAGPLRCQLITKVMDPSKAGIEFANDGGWNQVQLHIDAERTELAVVGSPAASSHLQITVEDVEGESGWFRPGAGMRVGLYGVDPVGRAAAIPSPGADPAELKQAVDAMLEALRNIGVTE